MREGEVFCKIKCQITTCSGSEQCVAPKPNYTKGPEVIRKQFLSPWPARPLGTHWSAASLTCQDAVNANYLAKAQLDGPNWDSFANHFSQRKFGPWGVMVQSTLGSSYSKHTNGRRVPCLELLRAPPTRTFLLCRIQQQPDSNASITSPSIPNIISHHVTPWPPTCSPMIPLRMCT